ncbi:MAG TPA: hypothetical protein VME92_19405 [Acetobacteraceae bacterium]|nr:hypothetical protein [Acetobacteraceae bacterium]
MSAFWSGTVGAFLGEDPDALVARLAHAQMARFATTQAAQLRAWADSIALLRAVLTRVAAQRDWRVLLEYGLLRLGRRIDVVLVTDRAVFVFEFKIGATGFDSAAREQVEDYALDLQDFHAASRHHPIVPILVASAARPPPAPWPLLLAGVSAVQCASADSLPGLLAGLIERLPPPRVPLDPLSWERAPYRPVPTSSRRPRCCTRGTESRRSPPRGRTCRTSPAPATRSAARSPWRGRSAGTSPRSSPASPARARRSAG